MPTTSNPAWSQRLTPRPVKGSIDELLAGATSREPWKTAESLSGSVLERVVIGGQPFVLKHLHVDDDWIQRVTGDVCCRPVVMWRAGLYGALPDHLEHAIVDVAAGFGRNGWGGALLMRDLSPHFVPVESGSIPLDQHLRFLEHMSELHAAFWGFEDTVGLLPMGNRYRLLTPEMAASEARRGDPDPVPGMVAGGWRRMADESPDLARIVLPLVGDPEPLACTLERGPQTLVHSDWKAGNLGSLADGRTILVDWAWPGRAPPTVDLAWYLAVNNELIPQTKEDTIDAYRSALERRGIFTASWWDSSLEVALLGAAVQLGWSKTGAELDWWTQRVPRALRYLPD